MKNSFRRRKGLLVVLSGPSGAGKDTVCKRILEKDSELVKSISYTTRPPRRGEEEGRDYFFVNVGEFKEKIRQDAFMEWVEFCGNLYGTPWEYVEKQRALGKDVILKIEVQGARAIRERHPEGVLIFLMPPSLGTLKRRMQCRGTDPENTVDRRLERAKVEIKEALAYDYIIINDDLDDSVDKLAAILTAERCATKHLQVQDIEGEDVT